MSEKFPSQPEGHRVTHADTGTFKDKAESLSVHRAALLWRNYLVRMQNNIGSYASRAQLLREIQEAAALESRGDVADPKHVALILPPEENVESMRSKLLEYLENIGSVSAEHVDAPQVTEREIRAVRAQFLKNVYELDIKIIQLQSQGRMNLNIPDILYRQQQIHNRELKAAELQGEGAFWEYTALCRAVQELCRLVDELLKPQVKEDI